MSTKAKTPVKGFKGFRIVKGKLDCRGTKFEVGKEFVLKSKPECCTRGFHFCENLKQVNRHYSLTDRNHVFHEVEALGDVHKNPDKVATNHIRIGRQVPLKELWLTHLKATVDKKVNTEKFRVFTDTKGYYLRPSALDSTRVRVVNSNWEPILLNKSKELAAAHQDGAFFTAHVIRYQVRVGDSRHYVYVLQSDLKFEPKSYHNLIIKAK